MRQVKSMLLRRWRSALFLSLTGSFLWLQAATSFAQSVSFSPATSFFPGLIPRSVAVGDFNGDGKPDLAVADNGATIAILLGNGNGSFDRAGGQFLLLEGPTSLAVGDFNGDGKLDLAVAVSNPTSPPGFRDVVVLFGTGTGFFGGSTRLHIGFNQGPESSSALVAGDFNGDGKLDLAMTNIADCHCVTNGNGSGVSVLLGTGAGSFGAATNFAVGNTPVSIAVGDFNRDGEQDLAVTNAADNNVSILLGNGTGSFGVATNFAVGNTPVSVAVGDFNGDGRQDLAVANLNSDNVSILLANGNGTFGVAANFAAGATPRSVAVADFNGDGKLDLAVANAGTDDVSILLGAGTGSFAPAANFAVRESPVALAIGDFNEDGKLDIVTANFALTRAVSILLNTTSISFTNLVSAVLPSSRSVQVGTPATGIRHYHQRWRGYGCWLWHIDCHHHPGRFHLSDHRPGNQCSHGLVQRAGGYPCRFISEFCFWVNFDCSNCSD